MKDIQPPINDFSIYSGPITNKIPLFSISLETLHRTVISDKYEEIITQIREAGDKKAKGKLKNKLAYVTPSGVFSPDRTAKNLARHSNVLVIDFDDVENLEETCLQLESDPYVAMLFRSPSGCGLKVFLNIDGDQHLNAFFSAAVYFQNEYDLIPDASGKDVSRACFLSHDPAAYFNPEPEFFKSFKRSLKKKKEFTPEERTYDEKLKYKSDDEYLESVVKRIEDSGRDITGNYGSEWLLIAFSLQTYGESGREPFHRISRMSSGYDAKETDKKFDNAIKTSRFTTPSKFYAIAKKYGVDIIRADKPKTKKLVETKKKATVSKTEKVTAMQEKNKDADYEIDTVWYYEESHNVVIMSGRSYKQVTDHFLIYVKYKTKDEYDEITWVLEAKRKDKNSVFIEVDHEEFCSASKLKRSFAKESLSLRLTDSDLSELHGYLFNKTEYKEAIKVVRFGWHGESKTYLFSNSVFCRDKLLIPDDFGIINTEKHYLSIPKSKPAMKRRHELTNYVVDVNNFVDLYASAHTAELGFIPLCFYVFSLFRDIAISHKNFSPILFLKGGAGTGKSSMIRVLTAAFGRKQEGVNLKNKNTEAALVKIMSQMSNGINWFDEYHNEFPYEGILQAAYDNDGYHRSSDTNSIDTNSVDIYSALALTSNYLPENPIFFSRCIFIPITTPQKTEAQRVAFNILQEMQEQGLGDMTVQLLKSRELVEDNYADAYQTLFNEFRTVLKDLQVAERLMTNMAQVMTAPYLLNIAGVLKLSNATDPHEILRDFIDIGQMVIERQHRITNESKSIAEFWEIIQNIYEQGFLYPDTHFKIVITGDVRELRLNFPKLYNLFAPKYRQVFMKTPPDRDTIQTEMALTNGNNTFEEISKPIRFLTDAEDKGAVKSRPVKNCCIVDYTIIQQQFGVDFESRNTNL